MEELSKVVLPHSSSSYLCFLFFFCFCFLFFVFVSSTYNEEIWHVGFSLEEFGCVSYSGWNEVSVAPNLASFQQPIADFDHPFSFVFFPIFNSALPRISQLKRFYHMGL